MLNCETNKKYHVIKRDKAETVTMEFTQPEEPEEYQVLELLSSGPISCQSYPHRINRTGIRFV